VYVKGDSLALRGFAKRLTTTLVRLSLALRGFAKRLTTTLVRLSNQGRSQFHGQNPAN
jgi:hypothetical protein